MSGPSGPTFDSQTLAEKQDYGSHNPAIEDGPRGHCVDPLTFTYHGCPDFLSPTFPTLPGKCRVPLP